MANLLHSRITLDLLTLLPRTEEFISLLLVLLALQNFTYKTRENHPSSTLTLFLTSLATAELELFQTVNL
jgi:hypothetical protein